MVIKLIKTYHNRRELFCVIIVDFNTGHVNAGDFFSLIIQGEKKPSRYSFNTQVHVNIALLVTPGFSVIRFNAHKPNEQVKGGTKMIYCPVKRQFGFVCFLVIGNKCAYNVILSS